MNAEDLQKALTDRANVLEPEAKRAWVAGEKTDAAICTALAREFRAIAAALEK